jgi:hypothetical protein
MELGLDFVCIMLFCIIICSLSVLYYYAVRGFLIRRYLETYLAILSCMQLAFIEGLSG